jgi:hypothetical protein
MKRIFSFFICIALALSLCSCGESVNMSVLTEYQKRDFEAELKIKSEGKERICSLTKKDGRFFLCIRGLDGFTFVFDENGAGIISGGTEIPFGSAPLPVYELYRIFTIPAMGTWKIEKSRPGGVSLYVCEGDGITLYIDALSHLPLKIISGGMEADVLSFKVK